MTGVIYYPYDIETEAIEKFISELSIKLNENEKVIVYLSSSGGDYTEAQRSIDFMNRFKYKIEIVCNWMVASAAVDIVVNTECKVKLLDDCFFALHVGSRDISYREHLKKDTTETFLYDHLINTNKKQIASYKGFFNLDKKEIKVLETGNDLFLNYGRIKPIIDKKNNNSEFVLEDKTKNYLIKLFDNAFSQK